MGICHDVEEGLEKYEITKIDQQLTDEDLNKLTKELTNAAGSVATKSGGRDHGHVGLIVEETKYITFSRGAIAEHKAKVVNCKTLLGVEKWIHRMIVKSVDHEWNVKLESMTMGFNH
eukprot:CCRYP_009148-RA/>CCRYP_009148-RA protein AED:0.45 eAED:0.45 QI:0/0/0/1/0/0.5/2/0/116